MKYRTPGKTDSQLGLTCTATRAASSPRRLTNQALHRQRSAEGASA